MRKIRELKKSTRVILMGLVILLALVIAIAVDALLSPFDIQLGSGFAVVIVMLYLLFAQS